MNVLANAQRLVACSDRLMDQQVSLIDALERSGANADAARALYYEMYRNILFAIEYVNQIQAGKPVASELRRECIDQWLRMLSPMHVSTEANAPD